MSASAVLTTPTRLRRPNRRGMNWASNWSELVAELLSQSELDAPPTDPSAEEIYEQVRIEREYGLYPHLPCMRAA